MKTIAQILQEKQPDILTIRPNDSVFVALQILEAYNIGALPVVSQEGLVGIFSERDYARKIALRGLKSEMVEVRDIMSAQVVTVQVTQSVSDCMHLMTERKIRHLPVLNGSELVGMLSIGDLLKTVIEDQQFQIQQLESYITQG